MAQNKSDSDNSNFESLASSLSDFERKDLLGKVNGDSKSGDTFFDGTVASNVILNSDEDKESILIRLNHESIFKRLILWIKAAFSSMSVEDVYNHDLIKQIAKDVDKNCPGLIDFKQHTFRNVFFDKIEELYNIQKYFKKFVEFSELHEGQFYVELGDAIMYETQNQIRTECDPFKFPKEQAIGNEVRSSMLQRMDELLDTLPGNYRTLMYSGARFFEWLKNFNKLPLDDFLRKFTGSGSGKECLFNLLRSDFSLFSKVMAYDADFNHEVFMALYYNYQKNLGIEEANFDLSVNDFIDNAKINSDLASTFGKTVNIRGLAKIVFENALYMPEPLGGFEAWFKKYKGYWKTLFDRRWEERSIEYKRQLAMKKMTLYFSLTKYPQFPARTWSKLNGIKGFRYDMTSGFLIYFFKNEFTKYQKILKQILVEGEFVIKENRQELTDIINKFNQLNEDSGILLNQFSSTGEFGTIFNEYAMENPLRKNHMDTVNHILEDASRTVESIVSNFASNAYNMECLLSAASGEIKNSFYGPMSNYNKIRGLDNSKFREEVDECRNAYKYGSEVLSELQNLEKSL